MNTPVIRRAVPGTGSAGAVNYGCTEFWPKSAFSLFGETEICDDANKKRIHHTLVWISANMSAVWTFFNVSEKDPRIAF